ncbi:MAG: restriction endonuclease [Verrucomicrobiales bacterium]|nr:restriction endonuclease [Verrucomicrobiales bacterium]
MMADPEAEAREVIDAELGAAGWRVREARSKGGATKGVFITTSGFVQNAWDYAASVAQRVILIDGQRLAELMIEHHVGVSTVRTVELKRVDTDYFEGE